ncbi:MAG: hypothetical protein HYS07_02205 [Chlamydiae bacterium]|nr:hypothetical protein [Chlamydiota bacterium]MBI3276739.1 hypothetical protein [Chlamydiota bacterium]
MYLIPLNASAIARICSRPIHGAIHVHGLPDESGDYKAGWNEQLLHQILAQNL